MPTCPYPPQNDLRTVIKGFQALTVETIFPITPPREGIDKGKGSVKEEARLGRSCVLLLVEGERTVRNATDTIGFLFASGTPTEA